MNGKERDPDSHYRIHGRGITIISSLCRIAPRRALHMSVKLMKILDVPDDIDIDLGILRDMVDVSFEEPLHAPTH